MREELIPPYYEVVSLTHESDEATFKACVAYRKTPPPGMSLSWLRNSAYEVLSGQLSPQALDRAVDAKLPHNARASVKRALQDLIGFARAKDWIGERLPQFNLEVGRGAAMPIRAVGRFHSREARWVVDVQPRLDSGPDLRWQMQTWLAFLNEGYCTDPLAKAIPLMLDVSRDERTRLRGFHAIDPACLPLIDRDELNRRVNMFIDCYYRAVEVVPVRPPRRERKRRADDDQPDLPNL